MKRRAKEIEQIGQTITKIGKDIPEVESILVETKVYKASVHVKRTNHTRSLSKISPPIVFLLSVPLLGIAVNIITESMLLISDPFIRGFLSLLVVIIGLWFGYQYYIRSTNT